MTEPIKKTDPFRTGFATLEGKLFSAGVALGSAVLLKQTGIDMGLLLGRDPEEIAKAAEKLSAGTKAVAEAYHAGAVAPVEFYGAVKFGMTLLFLGFLIARYIDRRHALKKEMLNARAAELQQ